MDSTGIPLCVELRTQQGGTQSLILSLIAHTCDYQSFLTFRVARKCYLIVVLICISLMTNVSWTVKKAECQRIDAFELWCWRRLLRVPWAARRSNQPILKEIIPGCALEGLILKLKLQFFGHLMQRADSLEKTLMLGKIEVGGERDDRG